jgi:hypothetical protein
MRYSIAYFTSIGIALGTVFWLPQPAHADLLSIALCSQEWETAIGIAQTYAKGASDPETRDVWLAYADRLAQVQAGTLSFDRSELEQLGCATIGQSAPTQAPAVQQPNPSDQPPAVPPEDENENEDDDDDDDQEQVVVPKVAVASWDYLNGTFVGRVINNGTTPVKFVRINYQVLDRQGNVLRTSFAVASPTVLSPGQAGQFLSFINQPGQDIEIKPGQVEWTES